jgi:hypothetical protein
MRILKGIFRKDKKQHNARNFIEILRTTDKELASSVKNRLEKFKIPVYEIDHQKSNDSSSEKIILRIPEKYLAQAKEILKDK